MSRFLRLRFALPALLIAALLPAALLAQSQDSDSVADAARRTRDQKKAQTAPKPAKVITDDDIKPPSPEVPPAVQTAVAPVPTIPGTDDGVIKPGSSSTEATKAPVAGDTSKDPTAPGVIKPTPPADAPAAPDPQVLKEIADLKASIKSSASDLDLLKRDLALQQDTFYSNTDYAHDTAGKTKLDDMRQQVSDKQAELEKLKARLAEIEPPADVNAAAGTPAAPPEP